VPNEAVESFGFQTLRRTSLRRRRKRLDGKFHGVRTIHFI
jgi:hypothetical protein